MRTKRSHFRRKANQHSKKRHGQHAKPTGQIKEWVTHKGHRDRNGVQRPVKVPIRWAVAPSPPGKVYPYHGAREQARAERRKAHG